MCQRFYIASNDIGKFLDLDLVLIDTQKLYVFFSFFNVIKQVKKVLRGPSPEACSGPVKCKILYVFFIISEKNRHASTTTVVLMI